MNDNYLVKAHEAANIIAETQIATIPPCIVCNATPKRLLNIVSKPFGLHGFSVCNKCIELPLISILEKVAVSVEKGPSSGGVR